ncbi:5246_t:CDS:2 [Funneliformis geosporum]|uniref:12577_t:CDS:1 n=1 Tax=Funneliformis geosporum TaxID=1117311 RepID=A0A9W4SNN1_9GLOM|nr:5246_t:CDS:2 [Funneliformis geosporum]CAI2176001.1 12577_t:CDS:2 [Funneliformis geosporum]
MDKDSPKDQPYPQKESHQHQMPAQSYQQYQNVNEQNMILFENEPQHTVIITEKLIPGQVDRTIPPVDRTLTGLTSLEQIWRMPLINNGKPTWKFWFALAFLLYIAFYVLSFLGSTFMYSNSGSYSYNYNYNEKTETHGGNNDGNGNCHMPTNCPEGTKLCPIGNCIWICEKKCISEIVNLTS